MTSPIDISFATAATSAAGATAAGNATAKAPTGGDKFEEIFSNLTHHSAGNSASSEKEAKTGTEDEAKAEAKSEAKADEKAAGKSATARDPAAFGRLLQRWASGEKDGAAADETADRKATAEDGAAKQTAQQAADGLSEQHAAAKARRTAQASEAARNTDLAQQQDAAEADLSDTTGLSDTTDLADRLADAAKGEAATSPKTSRLQGAEGGQPTDATRDILAEATDAIGTTRETADEAGRQEPGETGTADETKQQAATDRQPSAEADATPATGLSSLASAAVLQQQVAAKDAKADGGPEHPASGEDGADNHSSGRAASGDGDAEVNHIQVKVTRRETHFAPVLDLNQRQATASAGGKAAAQKSAQETAAREFAAAEATAKEDAAASAEGSARIEASAKADTADSSRTTVGERSAATSAASPGAGATGTTSATGFGSLTSLPFATAAQVSRAITEEAARMQNGQQPGPNTTAQGPVRILEMTVTPESLGRVVIHMRLTANGLEVRVRAAEAGTAQMLAQDHDALVRIIESSGTKVDSLDIVKSISSPVEASVRSTWTASQSSDSSAEQDGQQRREQGKGGDNSGRRQADDDAQSRSWRFSDASDD